MRAFHFPSCFFSSESHSEPNSPHNVCGFVAGMKTSITIIKEESRNKNLMILFVSCSKHSFHKNYCYCCFFQDSKGVHIILVLHHTCAAWRRKSATVCQDGSSIFQITCKSVTFIHLLINYIDLSCIWVILKRLKNKIYKRLYLLACTSWPVNSGYRTELITGVQIIYEQGRHEDSSPSYLTMLPLGDIAYLQHVPEGRFQSSPTG